MAATILREAPIMTHGATDCSVPADVISAAMLIAANTSDFRPDRVAEAKGRLALGQPDSHAIAEKIIARVLGDALR
ncbi:MAG TPA: flagellar biosynthesis anti-sigma factor FlgM [Coriobacteriia bacterium]|nr:flagellar biosynthesis anti-sigma factor FlgM [Coriobacteriia bacterium]